MKLSLDRKPSGFWKRQDVRDMLARYVRNEIDLDAATDFVEELCREMQVNQPRAALIEDVKWYARIIRKELGLQRSGDSAESEFVDLFVRGFPRELNRRLRALAAYREKDLSSLLAEAVEIYLEQAQDLRVGATFVFVLAVLLSGHRIA